jgi:hypothetical protein
MAVPVKKKRLNSSYSDNSRNKSKKGAESSVSDKSRNNITDRSDKRKKINQNMKKLLKYKMAKISLDDEEQPAKGKKEVSPIRIANNKDLKSLETSHGTLEHKLKSIRSPVKFMINQSSAPSEI